MVDSSPLRVYGSSISYYTGKFEAYLRYKEIPYELVPFTPARMRAVAKHTGNTQMPSVELPDGRFMTDTTPMIAYLESQYPEHPVTPVDPLVAFVALLFEDYAEEWHWRPAMHYRWFHDEDRIRIEHHVVDELLSDIKVPHFLKRFAFRRRQVGFYVQGDGVRAETRDHVEHIYLKSLDQLQAILETRPYLLGHRPSVADFGFFAPMFRHFAQDPTSGKIMRERAPAVNEWTQRLWDVTGGAISGDHLREVPKDCGPILDEIGSAYLPSLNANARAWAGRQKRFDVEIQGTRYRKLPVSQYRVWCLERLRAHHDALPQEQREQARDMLLAHPRVLDEEPRVRFAGFRDFSLDVEIRVDIDTSDANEFRGIREDIYLRVMKIVEDAGTGFAFPSRTVYHARDDGLDAERQQEAEAKVRAWGSAQELPSPNFTAEYRQKTRNTLDYPPEGSPAASQ